MIIPIDPYNNERGVILPTTLTIILIIAVLTTSLFARSVSERRLIEMEANRIIAFHLAEAGIDEAITELENNSSYSGSDANGITFGKGSYSTVVTTPDPSANPNVRKIVAAGVTPNSQTTSYAYQARTITAFVTLDANSLFNNAVFAQDKIEMVGNAMTDSYNSDLPDPYGVNGNIGANGDIGSNTIEGGNIELSGNASVQGDASVGPGGDPNQVIQVSENAVISGSSSASPDEAELPPVTIPAGLNSSGSLSLSGQDTMPLPAGTYLYDSVTISGNAKLVPDGPVTIYVQGEVDITGNGVATTGNKPSNFMINVVGEETVKISGNGSFYGVIYAPESGKNTDAVTITTLTGNTEIFGAVICYEFKANGNVKVHYDEALADLGGSNSSDVTLVSWQES